MNSRAFGFAVLGWCVMGCAGATSSDDAGRRDTPPSLDASNALSDAPLADAWNASLDTTELADAPRDVSPGTDASMDAGSDAPLGTDAGSDAPPSCAGRCTVGAVVCEAGATRTCALDVDGCGTFGPASPCASDLCADESVCATVNPFAPLCTSEPVMTRAAAIAFVGPGESLRAFGRSAVYRRRRSCNPATGCGAWGSPELVSGLALAEMVTEGTDFEIRFSEGPFVGREIQLGWSTPYADGRVNGCRWSDGLGGADSYCTLYLRQGCLRFESIYVDDTTQYAIHWSY